MRTFLEAVDRHLEGPARICIIGGTAAALGYGVETFTNDVDTYESLTDHERLEAAARLASAETGLAIPIVPSGIADLPYDYGDRVRPVMEYLQRLRVFVPDRHDLVLSKIIRWQENDIEHVLALHEREPLSPETLVARYLDEFDQAIGDPRTRDFNFLDCMERLFGELVMERARERVAAHRNQRRS
jgi:8-oxo-dGTP pyrophosphatase MutT (NUDIX family)